MMKAQIKYLVTLCILLLGVSGQLTDANSHTISVASHHPIINPHASSDDNIGNLQGNVITTTFTSASFDSKENTFFEYSEEVEEDEESDSIIPQKKNSENTYLSSTLFYSWYSNFLLLSNTQALHFSKHLFHFSYSKLFIVFQVFRI